MRHNKGAGKKVCNGRLEDIVCINHLTVRFGSEETALAPVGFDDFDNTVARGAGRIWFDCVNAIYA